MKIAIIFAGFFRTFDCVKESFAEQVLNKLDCDVFFVAPKTSFAMPENEPPELHHLYAQNADLVNPEWFGDRVKAYELIDHDAQTYKNIIAQNNISEKNNVNQYTWRILSYMHNISLSITLFEKYVIDNNANYDAVILTRPDIKYYRSPDVSLLDMSKINFSLHSMIENRLCTCDASPPSFHKPFNDQMVAGTQKNMLLYKNIYDQVIQYHKTNDISFISETFFGVHSHRNNVDCTGTDFVLYELWRKCQ